jgi:RNA polymerase sigma-70 factor, ECF subfamily
VTFRRRPAGKTRRERTAMAVIDQAVEAAASIEAQAASRDRPAHRSLDPDSRAWLARLRSNGPEKEAALAELHQLLCRAARHALASRHSLLPQLEREGVDDLVTQAADDALLSVLAHLDDYRGESRFTTWAWKFSFLEACVAVRKRRWLGREIPLEQQPWDTRPGADTPEQDADRAELLATLRAALEQALTPHQRRVFVALALNEVPADVLAERLGTTRGALYKTLHEARMRLRTALAAAGFRD